MDERYRKKLEQNIYKYYVFRVFDKRAFLPLIAIYAVGVAGVSLFQLGIIAALTAVIQLILEIPSGYISDKIKHKNALILGSVLVSISPLAYVWWPSFWGVFWGAGVFFAGVAFFSGTTQAFIHETLLELGREKELTQVLGKSQAVGMLGNVVIIALVPLTYGVDERLPFIIGAGLLFVTLLIAITFVTPIRTSKSVQELENVSFARLIKAVGAGNNYALFFIIGLATAVNFKVPEFREIYLQDIGVSVTLLGFILAMASLLAALFNLYIHRLRVVPARKFYIVDILVLTLLTVLIGFTMNPILGVVLFILFTAYGRSRRTLIHSYILDESPTRELKATYMSLYSFFTMLNVIWVPVVLGYLIGTLGTNVGYAVFGAVMLVLLMALYVSYLRRQTPEAAVVN